MRKTKGTKTFKGCRHGRKVLSKGIRGAREGEGREAEKSISGIQ